MTIPALWKRMIDRRGRIRCPATHCDRTVTAPSAAPPTISSPRHRRYLANRGEYTSVYRLWVATTSWFGHG